MRGHADRTPEEAARLRDRQIVLAEVQAVGVREEREIEPIVHHEGHARRATLRGERTREREGRAIARGSVALVAELEHRAPATQEGVRHVERIARTHVRVDDRVEPAPGEGHAAR